MNEDPVVICTQHLQEIGQALAAYERDQGELPHHLSDLYPEYLGDPAVFHCPADASSGGLPSWMSWFPGDPKLPVSYQYEFGLHTVTWDAAVSFSREPPAPGGTRRSLRQAARRYFGERVPVVTCRHHSEEQLFVPLSGPVYRSR